MIKKATKRNDDRDDPLGVTECFFINNRLFSAQSPEVLHAVGFEKLRHQARSGNADKKAREITAKLIVQILCD